MAEDDAAKALDVVIVGAGLVGSAAALALAERGRKVTLIEPVAPVREQGQLGFDLRTVALSGTSQALLAGLGIDLSDHGQPFSWMQVWEERGTASLAFNADDADTPHRGAPASLGRIVEVSEVTTRLWSRLVEHPGVSVLEGEAVEALQPSVREDDCVELQTAKRTLRSRLLIGADGGRSATRQLLDVAVDARPTGQMALVTVAQFERVHEAIARQRFLLDGPLALLPLSEPKTCAIVWSMSAASASDKVELADTEFAQALQHASESCLGRVTSVDSRVTFPLVQQVIDSFAPRPRVLFLGDAARVVHPLAGLGVNMGFEDVAAVLAIVDRLPLGSDLGGPLYARLARRRGLRAQLMTGLMSAFQLGFAQQAPLAALVRNMGMRAVDSSELLKAGFIRAATGGL
ncbi:MAG: FAD-dependent oxidoreductase [Pseudomonadaceae bacterium]|nr:FAD-dependent oxidoreductase [Pseudomonadaceae bacterium]